MPAHVPARVRLARLMTDSTDTPPPGTDLVFRVLRLRRRPEPAGGPPVGPAEDGVVRTPPVTCERCGRCWRPADAGRVPSPVIEPAP